MKRLYLLRHGKSSKDDPRLVDEERPLTPKGVRKTLLVTDYLKKQGIRPGLILSSHAVRAYETASLVAAGLDYPKDQISVDRKIYDGYYDRILEIIYGTDNKIGSLMIVGHNPSITQLANLFLNPGIDEMVTSAIVSISFDTDAWEKIPLCEATTEFLVCPKQLKKK